MGANSSTSRGPAGRDGEKDCHILLLGMTGAGKTSFFNFICAMKEIKRMVGQKQLPNQPLENRNREQAESGAAKTESQTDKATTYSLKGYLPRRAVKIVDCPGFGDTRGFLKDEEHCDKIVEEICNQRWLNAIVLVVKGTDKRIPGQLRYVLMRITSVLPKTILRQTIVVYTHCDITTVEFDHDALTQFFGAKIPQDRVLYVDNPFALMCNLNKPEVKSNPRLLKRLQDKVGKAFEEVVEDVEEIMTRVSSFPRISSSYFKELHDAKKTMEKEGVFMKQRLLKIEEEKKGAGKAKG